MIHTKIVCTIGPATREQTVLEELMKAGMDVARLNMSHATQAEHAETIKRIRAASEKVGKFVAILGDLQGPKLRVGELPNTGLHLEQGERVTLTVADTEGKLLDKGESKAVIPVQYQKLPADVKAGERILLDDGLLELRIVNVTKTEAQCEVITGGILRSRKGLNLPGTNISLPAVTKKDWDDLEFLIKSKVDWIALSFVRTRDDVQQLKGQITRHESPALVIAKIEKPQALDCIDEIIEVADGIMVARGDLGIEIPPEKVPLVQKTLIRKANEAGKPVITATQMLESMVRNPRPTRAEASDVANAILDGTDALMLSGETATGEYPVEAVKTMVRIAEEVEGEIFGTDEPWQPPAHIPRMYGDVTDAVAISACETAFDIKAKAIISATVSGTTSRSVARYRPHTPIIAVTPDTVVLRQLMLHWGITPLLGERKQSTDKLLRRAIRLSVEAGLLEPGDLVVMTAGVANNLPGATNLMTVEAVTERDDRVLLK